jgi:hypothetical protein
MILKYANEILADAAICKIYSGMKNYTFFTFYFSKTLFTHFDTIVYVLNTSFVVRAMAPYLHHKCNMDIKPIDFSATSKISKLKRFYK